MQMNESTMRMFRDILRFSYQNNLFYRTLYDKHSIDVETCMLPDSLPFVSADDLVRCALKMKSNIPLYRVCASSGTKRSPKLIFRSLDDFKFSVQNQMRLMQWCGIDRLDIIGIVQPSGLWGYADLTQEAAQCMGVMSVQLGNAENAVALELINRLKVSVLDIAPSRLEDLLNMAIKKNITLDSVRIAMCSGEITPP
jgi:phenylacetate-coenzyme A ligase PaaK-like adenylate-forming protein